MHLRVVAAVFDLGLKIFWQNINDNIQAIDYTYCCEANNIYYFSTIDHFASTPAIYNAVIEAGVIHSGENLLNHSAIYTKIGIKGQDSSTEVTQSESRVNWAKASNEAKLRSQERLMQL